MRAIFAGSRVTTCPANRVVRNTTAPAHKAAVTNVRKPGFLLIQSPLRFEGGTFISPACCSFPTAIVSSSSGKQTPADRPSQIPEREARGIAAFPPWCVEKNLTMIQEESKIGES